MSIQSSWALIHSDKMFNFRSKSDPHYKYCPLCEKFTENMRNFIGMVKAHPLKCRNWTLSNHSLEVNEPTKKKKKHRAESERERRIFFSFNIRVIYRLQLQALEISKQTIQLKNCVQSNAQFLTECTFSMRIKYVQKKRLGETKYKFEISMNLNRDVYPRAHMTFM